ncbi:caspase family protein [Bradyrhizobium sp. USDA 4353]
MAGLTAGLSQPRVPPRTLIAFAAQPGTTGQRGSDGHSAFSAALAQALQQQDRRLVDVFSQTAQSVERLTNGAQQPLVMFTQIDGGAQPGAATRRPAPASPTVSETPASPSATRAATATQDARTPGLAVLYDEDASDPKGKRYEGSVTWRLDSVKSVGGPVPVIRADIDIPERKLKVSLQLRRNDDPGLPASHVADLTFSAGADFIGAGVSNVPGMLMKTEEKARGTPLAGLAVKITEGSFLVGFSEVEADRLRNEELLMRREWIDIPIVYANQRRGILAIGKGPSGDRVFADAFAAWGKYQPGK